MKSVSPIQHQDFATWNGRLFIKTSIHVCPAICIYINTCMSGYLYIHQYMYVRLFVYTSIHVCPAICIYINTCMSGYLYIYINTCISGSCGYINVYSLRMNAHIYTVSMYQAYVHVLWILDIYSMRSVNALWLLPWCSEYINNTQSPQ